MKPLHSCLTITTLVQTLFVTSFVLTVAPGGFKGFIMFILTTIVSAFAVATGGMWCLSIVGARPAAKQDGVEYYMQGDCICDDCLFKEHGHYVGCTIRCDCSCHGRKQVENHRTASA